MIETQLGCGKSSVAVLAVAVVAEENVAAVEFDDVLRDPIVPQQADDTRHLEREADRIEPVLLVVPFCELEFQFTDVSPVFEVVRAEVAVLDVDNLGETLDEQTDGAAGG